MVELAVLLAQVDSSPPRHPRQLAERERGGATLDEAIRPCLGTAAADSGWRRQSFLPPRRYGRTLLPSFLR